MAYYDEKPIWIPKGTYNLTDVIDGITLAEGIHPIIQGAGSRATIITSSQTKVFDIANTAMVNGEVLALDIEGLYIRHDCQNATDITLDLLNAQVSLKNVDLINTNATKQGTAIIAGNGTAVAPSGYPNVWNRVNVMNYDIGFHIGLDHTTLLNCMTYQIVDKAFYIVDTFDPSTYGVQWITLLHPQVAGITTASLEGSIYPFYFQRVGQNIVVIAPDVESQTKLTHELFFMDQTAPTQYKVTVFGASAYNTQDDNFTNSPGQVRIMDSWRSYFRSQPKTFGRDASPFRAAPPTNAIAPYGTAATPTASTDYEVAEDCYITSTDSGNTDCAITVDTYGGTVIYGPVSTLTIPNFGLFRAGLVVNWGAFTGAAPTVTVDFV